jgi:hypothetical protein
VDRLGVRGVRNPPPEPDREAREPSCKMHITSIAEASVGFEVVESRMVVEPHGKTPSMSNHRGHSNEVRRR